MLQESESNVKTQAIPTFSEIIAAPETEWRQLAIQADADIDFCERVRARRAEQATEKTKHTRRPRRSRSRRNQTAGTAYSRQIANAMIEALNRVNGEQI